jgi:hypothetical protein
MITPREMLRDYMTVLNVLMQNPEASFEDIVKTTGAVATGAANAEADHNSPTPEARKFTPDDLDF